MKSDHKFMPTIKIKLTSTLYECATKYTTVSHNDRKMTAAMPGSGLSFESAKGNRKSLRNDLKLFLLG